NNNNVDGWIKDNLIQVIADYELMKNKELKLIVLFSADGLSYISGRGDVYGSIIFPKKEDELKPIFTTLITCFDVRAVFNAEVFEHQFGSFSPFFIKGKYLMDKYLKENQEEIQLIYKEWDRHFGKVYRSGDLNEELFIKHAYLSLLIKNVLFCKYLPEKVVQDANSLVKLSEYFDKRGVEMFFNDFYAWTNFITELREDIFQALKGSTYETDDIFRVIYQDMVSPSTRHALGEFYTPRELARLMIDEVYIPGQVVLDPACGSGTFLVEIISSIKKSNLSKEEKNAAIQKVYGFDVNPIAVLVSKANLLLHLEDIKSKIIPVNIFLTDSLFPIKKKKYQALFWGESEVFTLGEEITLKQKNRERITGNLGELIINKDFFSDEKINDFKDMLRIIDELMVFSENREVIKANFDKKCKKSWLDNNIRGFSKTYRENIYMIIDKLSELYKKKQNHIWLYLLYNSLGSQILRKKVDLIIGNPPWIVLNSIPSNEYQEAVKKLSERIGINPLVSNDYTQLEIASLFFFQCAALYGRVNTKTAFIMTKGVIDGKHCDRFRFMETFDHLKLWLFKGDMIFRVEHICLFGTYIKNQKSILAEKIPINTTMFKVKKINENNLLIEKFEENQYVPFYFNQDDKIAKKYLPLTEKKRLLPYQKSDYIGIFRNGGTIYPKSLIFVTTEDCNDNTCIINTDEKEMKYAKNPWKKFRIKDEKIEKRYIFNLLNSNKLFPFIISGFSKVFLPITREIDKDDNLGHLAQAVYKKINKIYIENMSVKDKKKFNELFDRVNYQNGLVNEQQKGKIKVVYNEAGLLTSAVIREECIVDKTCFLASFNNIDEAYYLVSFLNSPSLGESLEIIKDSRGHNDTKPLNFPIVKFDGSKANHMALATLGKKCEEKIINNAKSHKYKRKRILSLIKEELNEIDRIVREIIEANT
ncbi:MAG: N-6 DNA methylase, partial [Promethearchaeota archaeon]